MNRVLGRLGATATQRSSASTYRNFVRCSSIKKGSAEEFRSFDGHFENDVIVPNNDSWDPTGRTAHYAVMGGARAVHASLARIGVMKIVGSLSATADVLALSTVEVDLGAVTEGTTATIKWRGKPVFVKHRTSKEISEAVQGDTADLRDPQTDAERVQDPKWMIILGICTHLGCVPTADAGEYGAWFCPCHGSHYDMSGRIRKGPAPLNMEVPEYYLNGTTLKLGS
jgi:ubiquinol-cytochrome c reductase iron-sulfur subunit